jgi:RNA polymerase sigma-70 factor, ECF subfamily
MCYADTFQAVWRRLEAVPDDALPWLIGVARRTLADHLRAQRQSRALPERLGGDNRPDADMGCAGRAE